MFVDTAKVLVSAGRGGDGVVSFRHEIYVDKGGPDGGDGGRGGNVVFLATEQLNTLLNFRYKPELKAEDGAAGAKKKMTGRAGKDLVVKVPVGTLVKRDGLIIADLTESGQEIIIAKGGDGGFGNAHFKSSVRQTPRMAELGEVGESFEAELELKLLADVGLVGFPNAGKSTFLSVVSNARPEIANYEFTTLTPNLGVADIDDGSILIADIPGLIEGASEGKGLGDAFLRHVERTAVLLHLVDVYSDDIAERYQAIRRELEKYSTELSKRPEIIALTKCEGLDDDIVQMQIDAVREVAGQDTQILAISSAAHQGIREVLRALRVQVAAARTAEKENGIGDVDSAALETITLSGSEAISNNWEVQYDASQQVYHVSGDKIEKFARRTNFDQFESVNRLRDIMRRYGISHELARQGAEGDSLVQIGESTPFTLIEQ
jgi:obg family GTPase cgtA